ncbi:MAG: bifunctional oligoribonuclease/PAP phosphatase NrnA [Patescibacteria group bacterium]
MEATPKSQAVELIRSANSILILTHHDPDGDAIGSALGLRLALLKLTKQVDVIFSGEVAENLKFLPGFDESKTKLDGSNELVITIDTRSSGEELRLGHKKLTDKHQVMIVISPQKGTLVPEDVVVTRSRPKYDLVVMLDCATQDRLGPVLEQYPDLLFEVPTVSIDHHSTNSYFAKINWVDMTACATAEILLSLIEALGRNEPLIDEDIATALLTGLITDTGSFRYASTTPKALTVAAQLIAAGARQQEIVDRVLKTKSLALLKLWGRILSNIEENRELGFAWATIREREIKEVTGSETISKGELIDELLANVTDADFVFLLSEKEGRVNGSFRAVKPGVNVAVLAQLFGGGGHVPAAGFSFPGTLDDKEKEIIDAVTKAVLERKAGSGQSSGR